MSLRKIPKNIINSQKKNGLKIMISELEEDQTDDPYNDWERYEAVKAYFYSLNKEDLIFKDGFELFEVCKILIAKKFITEVEDRYAYFENVRELYYLMNAVQPWFTPAEQNDVPHK